MTALEVRLLGGFEVSREGRRLHAFPTRKARALLAYLAMRQGQPISRAALAGLLWPEQPSARAAQNLRQALTFLRRGLGPPSALTATRDEVVFDLGDAGWLDVAAFDRAVSAGLASPGRAGALAEAVALYRGALLEGFFLDDAPEFETWLVAARERLQAGALAALDQLAEHHLRRGEYVQAKGHLARALALDPWHEGAYRGLMRALHLSGDPTAALAQYEKCRRALAEGLNVEPLEATQALYRQILAHADTPVPAGLSPSSASLPHLPFVGRAEEHAQLAGALADLHAQGQPAGLVLIEGEAGTGKTRLAEEIIRLAASRGALILTGRCYEFGETVAYQPIVDALRSAAGRGAFPSRDETSDPFSQVWRAELSRLLPELRDPCLDLPEPTQAPDGTARQRLFEATLRCVQSLARGRPEAVVFLDDLQWADTATLDLLHYLVRQSQGSAMLFLGAYRPEETPAEHPLTQLRRGLSRDRLVRVVELEPLTPEAVHVLAASLVAQDTAGALARHLCRESEGNPFVLAEALHALCDTGTLRPDPSGSWHFAGGRVAPEVPLTMSLRDTVLRRVERLPRPAREALQLAAVIGRGFGVALLREAAGSGVEASLDLWVERRLAKPMGEDGGSQYDFAHDKIREVVYRDLPGPRRQALHASVAAAIERLHGSNTDAAAPALAHHYRQSAEPRRALPHLLVAARQAERVQAFVAAAQLCTQALDLEPDDLELRFEFLRLRQRAHEFLGQAEAEGADAEAMLATAEALGLAHRTAAALHRLALHCINRGQLDRARPAAERALALARELGDAQNEVDALILLALLARDLDGDPQRAFEMLEEGSRQAQAAGNRAGAGSILGQLGILRAERGEYVDAIRHYRDCLAFFREWGERSAVAGYLSPLASTYRALGQYPLAHAALSEAMRISEALGHATIQGWTQLNFGKLALWQCRPELARQSFERARVLATEHRLPAIEAQARLGLGQSDLMERSFASAREWIAGAMPLLTSLDAGLSVLSRAYMALALLGLGEPDAARAQSLEAMQAVRAGAGTFIEVQQVHLCLFRVLLACGERAEARRWLEGGRDIVLGQAGRLPETWRASFLELVPINRDILAAWGGEGT